MKWRLKTEFSNHQICSVYYSNNHRSQIIKYLSLSSTAHIYVNQCQVTQRLESVMSCNTSLLAESILSRNTSSLGKRKYHVTQHFSPWEKKVSTAKIQPQQKSIRVAGYVFSSDEIYFIFVFSKREESLAFECSKGCS